MVHLLARQHGQRRALNPLLRRTGLRRGRVRRLRWVVSAAIARSIVVGARPRRPGAGRSSNPAGFPRTARPASRRSETGTMARGTTAATSSPRLTSSSRNPPATAVSSTSLTVASCACATALTGSRLLRMRRIRRSAPTTLLRLLRGEPRSANAVRAVCQAARGWWGPASQRPADATPFVSPVHLPCHASSSSARAVGTGAGAHGCAGSSVASERCQAMRPACPGPRARRRPRDARAGRSRPALPPSRAGTRSATAAGSGAAAAAAAARRRRPAAVRPRAPGPAPPARAGRCRTTAHPPTAAAPAPAGGRRAPDGTAAPECSRDSIAARTAGSRSSPRSSSSPAPSKTANAPRSCGQPRSSGQKVMRSCAVSRSMRRSTERRWRRREPGRTRADAPRRAWRSPPRPRR